MRARAAYSEQLRRPGRAPGPLDRGRVDRDDLERRVRAPPPAPPARRGTSTARSARGTVPGAASPPCRPCPAGSPIAAEDDVCTSRATPGVGRSLRRGRRAADVGRVELRRVPRAHRDSRPATWKTTSQPSIASARAARSAEVTAPPARAREPRRPTRPRRSRASARTARGRRRRAAGPARRRRSRVPPVTNAGPRTVTPARGSAPREPSDVVDRRTTTVTTAASDIATRRGTGPELASGRTIASEDRDELQRSPSPCPRSTGCMTDASGELATALEPEDRAISRADDHERDPRRGAADGDEREQRARHEQLVRGGVEEACRACDVCVHRRARNPSTKSVIAAIANRRPRRRRRRPGRPRASTSAMTIGHQDDAQPRDRLRGTRRRVRRRVLTTCERIVTRADQVSRRGARVPRAADDSASAVARERGRAVGVDGANRSFTEGIAGALIESSRTPRPMSRAVAVGSPASSPQTAVPRPSRLARLCGRRRSSRRTAGWRGSARPPTSRRCRGRRRACTA